MKLQEIVTLLTFVTSWVLKALLLIWQNISPNRHSHSMCLRIWDFPDDGAVLEIGPEVINCSSWLQSKTSGRVVLSIKGIVMERNSLSESLKQVAFDFGLEMTFPNGWPTDKNGSESQAS